MAMGIGGIFNADKRCIGCCNLISSFSQYQAYFCAAVLENEFNVYKWRHSNDNDDESNFPASYSLLKWSDRSP
jgi:hypothetical protein